MFRAENHAREKRQEDQLLRYSSEELASRHLSMNGARSSDEEAYRRISYDIGSLLERNDSSSTHASSVSISHELMILSEAMVHRRGSKPRRCSGLSEVESRRESAWSFGAMSAISDSNSVFDGFETDVETAHDNRMPDETFV